MSERIPAPIVESSVARTGWRETPAVANGSAGVTRVPTTESAPRRGLSATLVWEAARTESQFERWPFASRGSSTTQACRSFPSGQHGGGRQLMENDCLRVSCHALLRRKNPFLAPDASIVRW